MSINQAAIHYNLPYSSLYGRFKRGKYDISGLETLSTSQMDQSPDNSVSDRKRVMIGMYSKYLTLNFGVFELLTLEYSNFVVFEHRSLRSSEYSNIELRSIRTSKSSKFRVFELRTS